MSEETTGSGSANKTWFENGNPRMMFVFGFVTGVAAVSLLVSGSLLNSGGVQIAAADAETAPTVVVDDTTIPTAVKTTKSDVPAVTKADHVRGNPDAKVVVIEYSDFECPFCSRHHPTMVKLMEEYPDDVAWVYRHFPLSFHPEAEPAAIASECANEQGKFWEFADAMFEGQDELGEDFYIATATELGLNTTTFTACLDSGKYDDLIANQTSTGAAAGVTGTPATFINGSLVSGAVPYATLQSMVEAELK